MSLFVVALAAATFGVGCSKESLKFETARLVIEPQPTSEQSLLEDPTGIDLGRIPLFGLGTANFTLRNDSRAILRITETNLKSLSGGTTTIGEYPAELAPGEQSPFSLTFSPTADETNEEAIVEIIADGGAGHVETHELRITATGFFVGQPRLEVKYSGVSHPPGGECETPEPNVSNCAGSPLAFGNVPLGQSATQVITLRNLPEPETCLLPPLQDGSVDCTPVCLVTIDKNTELHDIGLGFLPADGLFELAGSVPLPFAIAPANPSCPSFDGNVVRGELELLLSFRGDDEEGEHTATFHIESNAPNMTALNIPVSAAARRAPVAVAKLQPCFDGQAHGDGCSVEEQLAPLQRVYLNGRDSFDPATPDDPEAIVAWSWEVLDWPDGADTEFFDPQGANDSGFSFWMPLAGQYRVRLTVTNQLGVESGVSTTSDVSFVAIPEDRLHVQLVWDTTTTDLDLHLVYTGTTNPTATTGDVYNDTRDCYWKNCRPGCQDLERGACQQPAQWFPDAEPFTENNPRLDIDDTNGLGPENTNITTPAAGSYRIYVHNYAIASPDDTPTTWATIRIYASGVLRGEFRRALDKNWLWAVAQIEWLDTGDVEVTAANSDNGTAIGAVVELPYLPPSTTGYVFDGAF